MEDFLRIVEIILLGDLRSIVFILSTIIAFLIWDRIRMIKQLAIKEQKIEKIIEDYHKGNLTLAEALNSVRIVMHEIKAKL